jgi:hypothetical protein
MTYADAIRPIRNRLRKFSYCSVMAELSQFIKAESTADDEKPHAPWLAALLANEALEQHVATRSVDFRHAKAVADRRSDFARLLSYTASFPFV